MGEKLVAAAPDNDQQDEEDQNHSKHIKFAAVKDAAHVIHFLLYV